MNPNEAIKKYVHKKSNIGIGLLIIHILIFSFVACINVTQMINFLISNIIGAVTDTIKANSGMGNLLSSVNFIPDIKIPTLYSMYGWLCLCIVVMCFVEVVGIYLVLSGMKKKPASAIFVINIVAIANLPIMIGAILNLLFGLIFPPLTLAVLIASVLIHMIFIYEGLKEIALLETQPVWAFSILVVILCIVYIVFITIIMNKLLAVGMEYVASATQSFLGNLSNLLGNLSSLW